MSIEWVMPSSHLISVIHFSSSIRVFSSELTLHIRRPKYWSFSFRISPSSEYSGLIYFRIDWLDLLAVPSWLSGKDFACSAGDTGSIPGSRRSLERKWQPAVVFLPGKSVGQRSLMGYSPRGLKRVEHNLVTKNNNN